MYSIRKTQDFYPLSLLYQESGLEVTPGHTPPQGTLSMLRCEDSETGELVAAVLGIHADEQAARRLRQDPQDCGRGHAIGEKLTHEWWLGKSTTRFGRAPRQAAGRPGTLAGGKGSRLLRPVSVAHCSPRNGSSHFPLSHLLPVPSGLFSQHYEKGTLF